MGGGTEAQDLQSQAVPGDQWDLQRVKDTRSDLGEGRFVEDEEGCYSS